MNIFCDMHHADLLWSLHIVFEKILGHKVYVPRGNEWLDKEYFCKCSFTDQMLNGSFYEPKNFPHIKNVPDNPNIRLAGDTLNGCPYYPFLKTLTFEEFEATEIDIIVPTLSNNQIPFLKLQKDIKPKAKVLKEAGNIFEWPILHKDIKNLLTSDLDTFNRTKITNKVLYHQRFDCENIFYYKEIKNFKNIRSFMPGLRKNTRVFPMYEAHVAAMPDFEFKDYGHTGPNGFISNKVRFANEMRNAAFIWHVKPGGDGFGHVIHNSLATGRVVLTVKEHYEKCLAGLKLKDMETCVCLDLNNLNYNVDKIRSLKEEDIIRIGKNAKDEFFKTNYEEENERIKKLIENLI